MAFLLGEKVLRTRKKKAEKKRPLTNAEKCKARRERRKQDQALCAIDKAKKKEANHLHYQSLTPDMREQRKKENTQSQTERRQRLKEQKTEEKACSPKTPKKCSRTDSKSKTPTYCTRTKALDLQAKADARREKNRLSQQKRRANMHPQKKRRELEKKRQRYHQQKTSKHAGVQKARNRFSRALFGLKEQVKMARSKMDLWKSTFLKMILARKDVTDIKDMNTFYKRPQTTSHAVEHFLNRSGIDYPGQRGSSTPKKVLTKTMETLFKEFKAVNPNIKMSLTTFKRRRPPHILLSSSRKFQQCLCETCTNLDLIIETVNKLIKQTQNTNSVSKQQLPLLARCEDLVKKTLCVKETKQCVERKCLGCGVGPVMESVKDSLKHVFDREITWCKWEKTENSRKDLVEKSGRVSDAIQIMEEMLSAIAKHVIYAKWQRQQYQNLKDKLPPGHSMCTVDFAENYLCKFQNEVQSAHWSYRQVTVHPCVFFYRCQESDCHHLITDYMIVLSDDLKHGSDFTRHIFNLCIERMKTKGMAAIHIFSDGCSSQYKSRYTFQDISNLQREHSDITITRHYFGSSHGKSLCDSSGGVVKNACSNAVRAGSHIIQSAKAMFDYCTEKMTYNDSLVCGLHSERSFVLVSPADIARENRSSLLPLKGTRSVHSSKFSSVDDKIHVRDLSCFCDVCMLGETGQCPNEMFIGQWKTEVLTKDDEQKCLKRRKPKAKQNVKKRKRDDTPVVEINSNSTPVVEINSNSTPVVEINSNSTPVVEINSNSTPVPDTNSHVPSPQISETRYEYFAQLQEQFSNCSNFGELRNLVHNVVSDVAKFPMPKVTAKRVIDVGIVDAVANDLVPDFLRPMFPVLTVGDGNCVPRALSLLCFGNQDHHTEIRCRIVMELITNPFDYLCLKPDELQLLQVLSDSYDCDLQNTFQNETFNICRNSVYMGMWQIMAASNVLGAKIFSVYPELGSQVYRDFFTRKISPRKPTSSHTITLLWSATVDHTNAMSIDNWTANHVVPLMGLGQFIDVDSNEI